MFKKLRLLFIYIKILNKHRDLLKQKHNISIDWVWRMYKTYVISLDDVENVKDYGFKYVNELLKKEMVKIDTTFMSIGLSELVGLMEAVDISQREIGLAFRFKYIDTAKLASRFFWLLIYIFAAIVGYLISSFLGLGIGIAIIFVIYLLTRIIL